MPKYSIACGILALLVLDQGDIRAQGVTGLPLEGAPVAEPGPYDVISEPATGSTGLLIFHPGNLDELPNETLPVLVWANGGCVKDSESYRGFLTTIASHGFLVLTTTVLDFEAQGRPAMLLVDGAVQVQVPPEALRGALDWAEAEARRESSPLYGKIATDSMAVMGQSCGAMSAVVLGSDPRVDTIGLLNGSGIAPTPPVPLPDPPRTPFPTLEALANLLGPVLVVNGHEADFVMAESANTYDAIDYVPAFYGARRDAGHLGTFEHPGGGEFANVVSNWLKWTLNGDEAAGEMFLGEDCGLCGNTNWEVRSKRLR